MRKTGTFILLAACLLCACALFACGGKTTIALDKATANIEIGETVTLAATVNDGTAVTFQAENDCIDIRSDGATATVTGVKPGAAMVTAKAGNATATCRVIVASKDGVSLQAYAYLEDGGTEYATATLTASYMFADEATGTVEFTSANPAIVTVESAETGVATLTAVHIGKTTVTARVGEETATCTVEVASHGIEYGVASATSVIVEGGNVSGELWIPDMYCYARQYIPVREVAVTAFRDNVNITSLHAGDNVAILGANAFAGCAQLKSVTLGKGIRTLGDQVFHGCNALDAFDWGESKPTSIGSRCFGFTALTEFTVPESVGTFGAQMFWAATKLTSCKIYAQISEIKESTFLKCDALAHVYLPATVASIGASAFGGYQGYPVDGPLATFTIHFAGTQAQWTAVQIDSNNNGVLLDNASLSVVYEAAY